MRVLGYFTFRFKSLDDFKLFFTLFLAFWVTDRQLSKSYINPRPWLNKQYIRRSTRYKYPLKWFLLLQCQGRDINIQSRANALANKQAQLITKHIQDFSDTGQAIKGLVVCWMLLNLISKIESWSIATKWMMPLGSLDDHLKSKENPVPIRQQVNLILMLRYLFNGYNYF